MKQAGFAVGICAGWLLCSGSLAALWSAAGPVVVLETEFGAIEVQLDPARAPRTVHNFLRYVEHGFYDGGQFHRTVKLDNQPDNRIRIEVIQASVKPGRENEGFEPIPLERTSVTGLRHTDGVISMARDGPDTAHDSFFITVGDQPSLDYGGMRNPDGQGFAAFGRVTLGMEIVRRIQHAPAKGQQLHPAVKIRRAYKK